MLPEAAKLLTDVLQSLDRIIEYTSGKTRSDYLETSALRDAVQWNFAVIGEALAQLRRHDAEVVEKVTEWRRIIAFRNQLIHGYGVIQHDITWDIIQSKLPRLRSDVRRLLEPD